MRTNDPTADRGDLDLSNTWAPAVIGGDRREAGSRTREQAAAQKSVAAVRTSGWPSVKRRQNGGQRGKRRPQWPRSEKEKTVGAHRRPPFTADLRFRVRKANEPTPKENNTTDEDGRFR